eukprot:GHVS01103190.1.p1 GENE.GHVS01103190.1~~GHVS01103190.1.p1  ORF type:complete len:276 (+),score=37.55 GHVS01103190.1:128-955(+)
MAAPCVALTAMLSEGGVHLLRAAEDVFVIRLDDGADNRISYALMEGLHKLLDNLLEQTPDQNCALVLTGSGGGRFFSNGLRLEDLGDSPKRLLLTFHKLLLRLLTFPMPTVAAINGHAFAGGAMLCLACDYRVMNSDKGFLCVNEVDIGLTLTPGLYAVVRAKADRSVWTEIVLGGKRFTGHTAKARRLVDELQPAGHRIIYIGLSLSLRCLLSGAVFSAAVALAASVSAKGCNRSVYRGLKAQLYADEVKMLSSGTLGEAEFLARQAGDMRSAL